MNDDEFLAALEDGSLPPSEFNHAGHLRAAFCYLARQPFLEACIAMRDSVKAFAARLDKASLYHETITIALMALINERRVAGGHQRWQELIDACPDLSDRHLLSRYYSTERLAEPLLREYFVLPVPPQGGEPSGITTR
jgi:hypothetical protein